MAENKDKKVLNVPNIRFKEFKEEWVECKISDILSIGNGRDYRHLDNGNIPVFGTGGCITSVNEYLYDGETTFIGRKGTINKPFYYDGKFWTVDTLFYTHSFIDVTPKFVFCLFQTINWLRYNEASGVPSLSKDTIEKIKIKIPKQSEQKKIVNLFFALDERIATQNKIIDKLESLIKGIRSKLYKDLLGKELFLGDISDIYQPKTISSTELIDRGFPVYGANGIIGYYDQYNHEMEQICITCRGNTCGTINFSQQKSWITGNAMVVNTDNYKDIVDKRYLFHLLVDYNFNNIISGSGQPQIVRTPLEKIKIKLPIIDKQKQIAKSLDSILQKIDIEKYSLSLLNSQKQYLLRQMFI